MIDQTTAELINTDIDGRLPAAQRAELSRILLADPEARALHRDLQRLQRELAAVTAEPAPAGLADSIMAAIPAVASGGGRPGAARPWRSAVALAVGAAVVAVVLHVGGLKEGLDGAAAVGTMAPGAGASAPVTLDHPEISGSVRLSSGSGSLLVEIDVAPREDVEVTAVRADSSSSAFLRAGESGDRQRLALELPAGESGPVSVRFTSHGRIIDQIRLDPAPGR